MFLLPLSPVQKGVTSNSNDLIVKVTFWALKLLVSGIDDVQNPISLKFVSRMLTTKRVLYIAVNAYLICGEIMVWWIQLRASEGIIILLHKAGGSQITWCLDSKSDYAPIGKVIRSANKSAVANRKVFQSHRSLLFHWLHGQKALSGVSEKEINSRQAKYINLPRKWWGSCLTRMWRLKLTSTLVCGNFMVVFHSSRA